MFHLNVGYDNDDV